MGFYIKDSVSVGPLRFNLSKSGIGVSAGIKGLRVGTGPRGNYIHMGRGGLYYRKTLPSISNQKKQSFEENITPSSTIEIPSNTHAPLEEIESATVLGMTDSDSVELLNELNGKRKKQTLWPIALGLGRSIAYRFGILVHDWFCDYSITDHYSLLPRSDEKNSCAFL